MKKILCVLLVLALVSCGPAPEEPAQGQEEFQTGQVGVVASFIPDAPPVEIDEEAEQMDIGIEMENLGGFDVEQGIISMIVEEPLVVDPTYHTFQLKGKGPFAPQGEKDVLLLKADVGSIPGAGETFQSSVSATFCYAYETEATINVCIDPEPFSQKQQDKVCILGEQSVGGGQGGPIGITRVVAETPLELGEDQVIPRFKIYIENLGDGELVKESAVENACRGRLSRQDFDEINIEAKLAGQSLKCDKRSVRLRDEDTFIRCQLEEGVAKRLGTYVSPLYVKMSYGYRFTIREPILVYRS